MLDNGYGIMPNTVLFDSKISPSAKLLYVVISSLCAEKGYCYASNAYLGRKMNLSTVSISKHISSLSDYINIDNPKNELRQIRLKENLKAPQRKLKGSLKENLKHINTSTNIISNNIGKPFEDHRGKPSPAKEAMRIQWQKKQKSMI